MARQPTLTVQVNSQQFQQFATQFNQFSGQIRNLNRQFAQINVHLNRSNVLMRTMQGTVNLMVSGLKMGLSLAGKITKQFLSWSTIIGAVTGLLGAGSLYGIDRLAASIMAKRRQALGLGQDYGRTQASQIFSQGLMGNAGEVMSNVRMGQAGAPEQMTGLMTMGLSPFGAAGKMKPDDLMDAIIKKLPMINAAGPGMRLQLAHAYGFDRFIKDPLEILRLSSKEGQKEWEEKKKLTAEYAPFLNISKKAQKAWAELEMQFQAAKASLESGFGEALADLATPLRHLSQAFAQLVRTFMDTPIVKAAIKWLGKQIDLLAEKMKLLKKEDIEDFIKKVREWLPTMDQFKSAMSDFIDVLKGVATVFGWLKYLNPATAADALGTGRVHDFLKDKGLTLDKDGKSGSDRATDWLTKNVPWASDQAIKDYITGKPSTAAPTTTAPPTPQTPAPSTTPAPQTPAPTGPFGGAVPGGRSGLGVGTANTPGFNQYGQNFSQTAPGAGKFSWFNSVSGAAGGFTPPATQPALTADALIRHGRSHPPLGPWSGAAQKMTPGGNGGGGGMSGRLPSIMGTDPGLKPGPLSMNNWQMNRTASLVVRNVPGSNIFMSAAGMTG